MRVLEGTRVVEASDLIKDRVHAADRVVIDVGAGDGRWVYEAARKGSQALFIGMDPDADALAEYAYRASRKPARGGVENVIYVVAAVEQLPAELAGIADLVRVNFPWGGLLRGLLKPDAAFVSALASLAKPGGSFEIVLTYDPEHDHGATPEGEVMARPSEDYLTGPLAVAYEQAGISVDEVRPLSADEALAIPSTWGRRLLHGRAREVFLLSGSRL
jgi:16S rRNA (adenine(1408)-N(1))-methyltransferase